MPGIGETSAQAILAVIGTDMSRFPTAGHLASWAGLCPGNNESVGKRKSGRTTKGNCLLREVLITCAHSAILKKSCGGDDESIKILRTFKNKILEVMTFDRASRFFERVINKRVLRTKDG